MNVHERIFALSPDLSGVWAITPEAMTAFVDALAGVAEAGQTTAAASGDAAAANAAPYVMDGPVAIIPVKGAMSKTVWNFGVSSGSRPCAPLARQSCRQRQTLTWVPSCLMWNHPAALWMAWKNWPRQ